MHLPSTTNLNAQASPEAFMTIPQFCRLHGFKPHAVRRAAKLGLFPLYQPFGRRWYILPSEVLAFVNSCTEGGPK